MTSPQKWQLFNLPPPMSPLVTISGYPLPTCHRVNNDKLSLRIQVTKTIWGRFKNSNDTRICDKSARSARCAIFWLKDNDDDAIIAWFEDFASWHAGSNVFY